MRTVQLIQFTDWDGDTPCYEPDFARIYRVAYLEDSTEVVVGEDDETGADLYDEIESIQIYTRNFEGRRRTQHVQQADSVYNLITLVFDEESKLFET